MSVEILHLHEAPELIGEVAALIHDTFWADRDVYTVAQLEQRLRHANAAGQIPLSLVAVERGMLRGTVNLIHSDDEARPHLSPWLAALVVVPQARGRGIGTALVNALLGQARAMGVSRLFLGTDNPGYYERFGAVLQEQAHGDLVILSIPLSDPRAIGSCQE